MNGEKKHTVLGKVSLLLAIIAVIGTIIGYAMLFNILPSGEILIGEEVNNHRGNPYGYKGIISVIFGFIAIFSLLIGIVAKYRKGKDTLGGYATIISIICICLDITLSLMVFTSAY